MTIVVRVHTSDGCLGQCDRKCYDAAGGRCSCVCGGQNHGKGLTVALANVHALSISIGSRRSGLTLTVDPRSAQTVLPWILDT